MLGQILNRFRFHGLNITRIIIQESTHVAKVNFSENLWLKTLTTRNISTFQSVSRNNGRFVVDDDDDDDDGSLLKHTNSFYYFQKRFKSNKKKHRGKSAKAVKDEDEEEGDEEDEDTDSDDDIVEGEGEGEDSKTFQTTVISCRLDAIGKTCFNMARSKFDESFYSNLVRVNGERVGKKSHEIRQGDEIDLIRGFNFEDRQRLDVNRVQILKLDDKAASSGRYRLTYKKTNKLTIDNYERDPYDGTLIST